MGLPVPSVRFEQGTFQTQVWNPTGHYMYQQFNTISTFSPHSVLMCFVWISEQIAIISLYNINWLVCITESECVYCAVRTGSLYINQTDLRQCRSSYEMYTHRYNTSACFEKGKHKIYSYVEHRQGCKAMRVVCPTSLFETAVSALCWRMSQKRELLLSNFIKISEKWSCWAVRFTWRQTDCHTDLTL